MRNTRQEHGLFPAVLYGLIGINLAIVLSLFAGLAYKTFPPQGTSAKDSASTVRDPCVSDVRYVCYSKYFQAETKAKTAVTALKDLESLAKTNNFVLTQCHQLTHSIGHAAYKKYGTLGKAFTQGNAYCTSGYYHGVTESAVGSMSKAELEGQLSTVCSEVAAKVRYSLDHFNCAHGLGHGLLGVEGDNLFVALTTCDRLSDPWERSSCYGGVFMENIMIPLREGGTSEYLKADQPMYPCTAVDTKYKDQCYGMQTSYALQVNSYDFSKVASLCQNLTDVDFVGKCYQSLGRDVSGSTNAEIHATKAKCAVALDTEGEKNCMIGAVKDIAYHDHSDVNAQAYCALYEAGELRSICTITLESYMPSFRKPGQASNARE